MKYYEQLILEKNKKHIIELDHIESFINISKMIISVNEINDILLNDMILKITYIKNDKIIDTNQIYLASLLTDNIPILNNNIELPSKKYREYPNKLELKIDKIELEFSYKGENESSLTTMSNYHKKDYDLYLYYEKSTGIRI
jgi:hypothetical protein